VTAPAHRAPTIPEDPVIDPQPAPPSPTAPEVRWAQWRDLRWLYSAIWLLFLAYPISSVATADRPPEVKALGFLILAVFAVVYLLLSVYVINPRAEITGRNAWVILPLVVLTGAMLPIIGENAFGLGPFLMAVAAFTFPTLWAAVTVAAIIVLSVLLPAVSDWELDLSVLVILVCVGFTLLGFRAMAQREQDREYAEKRQRELNARLALVAERERVARDVHDILGHSLTVISVKSELAGKLLDRDPQRARTELAEVNQLARESLAQVRATVGQLRSPDLPSGLAAAESALRAAGVTADLPPAAPGGPHDDLFAWVLREAVTNVVRHSGASRCTVTVTAGRIRIADDGRGMDPERTGNGLQGLRERVGDAGGRLEIASGAGGTTITATAPDETGDDA